MDPVTMTFYAVVCGGLAVVSPSFNNRLARVAVGVSVGLAAAMLLPLLRNLFSI